MTDIIGSAPALLAACREHQGWALDVLHRLVSLESPTDDVDAVNRCGRELERVLREMGAGIERLPQTAAGDHLRAEFGAGDRQVLILCHFDTVWPVGQLERMPLEARDGRLYGPGVYDMKGGIAIALLALRALATLRMVHAHGGLRIVALFTTDEEVGSETSRAIIEQEARCSEAVLVLEPALANGGLKTWRKGVGEFSIEVEGVSAHAGAEPDKGASAIVELARLVEQLHALNDPARGVSVNVGVISGGTRSNVVPERASAIVDARVVRLEDAAGLVRAMGGLQPRDPRVTVTIGGGMNRPPMERSEGALRLFALAQEAGREVGIELEEGGTGGASDGNFTAALGVPTLDGLGAVGDGAHALHEHVVVESVPQRAAVLAGLLARL
jgi:glutamate carboxypeptidase